MFWFRFWFTNCIYFVTHFRTLTMFCWHHHFLLAIIITVCMAIELAHNNLLVIIVILYGLQLINFTGKTCACALNIWWYIDSIWCGYYGVFIFEISRNQQIRIILSVCCLIVFNAKLANFANYCFLLFLSFAQTISGIIFV